MKRKVPVQKEDLVHIHRSPNFCVEDPKRGILGTGGRQCNRTAIGPQSCSVLCCGRGYNTQVILILPYFLILEKSCNYKSRCNNYTL